MSGSRSISLSALFVVSALLAATMYLGGGEVVAQDGFSVALDVVQDGNTFCNPVNDSVEGVSGSHKVAVCAQGLPGAVGAFQFDVIYNSDLNGCPDVANAGTALDDNPDANAGATTWPTSQGDNLGTGWDCSGYGFAYPECDGDPLLTPPAKAARIYCLSTTGPFTLGDDETVGVLGVVNFNVAGADALSLANVVVTDDTGQIEYGTCNPSVSNPILCSGAALNQAYAGPAPTSAPAVVPEATAVPGAPLPTAVLPPVSAPAAPVGAPETVGVVPPPTGTGWSDPAGGSSLWLAAAATGAAGLLLVGAAAVLRFSATRQKRR